MAPEITYQPDNCLKNGYLKIIPDILRELRSNRWLILQLFKRDIFALYRQSFIGLFWAVIIPIISVSTFIVLNRSGVFVFGEIELPYPIYAVLGIAFWQLFSTGLLAASNSLVKAGPMIVKINFSKKSLVLASMGQTLISFAVQLLLTLSLFAYFGVAPRPQIFLIPLFAIPVLAFTLGIGFLLSIINGILRDVGNIISVVMTFLMFLTPVLYPRTCKGLLAAVTGYNPLYYLVSVPRDVILFGGSDELGIYAAVSVFSILILAACIVIFHVTEARVAERI